MPAIAAPRSARVAGSGTLFACVVMMRWMFRTSGPNAPSVPAKTNSVAGLGFNVVNAPPSAKSPGPAAVRAAKADAFRVTATVLLLSALDTTLDPYWAPVPRSANTAIPRGSPCA